MSTETKRSALLHSEDWVSVWLGFGLIAIVLLGFRPDLPGFGWDAGSVGKAFSTFNLQSSFVLGAVFIMTSGLRYRADGRAARRLYDGISSDLHPGLGFAMARR